MKGHIFKIAAVAALLCGPLPSYGQDAGYSKTGWSFSPFPAVSYDSDLGFQFGVYLETYYFGDGSKYPEYLHKIVAEAAYFTKGSGIYHLFYDTKYLLPGLRLTASASYLPSTMSSFHGFNGYPSPLLAETRNEYKAFYNMERKLFRAMADLQGEISGNFGWTAGLAFYGYRTGSVSDKKYGDEPSLYKLYLEEGIIRPDEAGGGRHIELRTGIVYDTRDNEPDPRKGIYSSAVLYGSPDIIGRRGYDYLKLSATFCHYVPLTPDKLTLAYRFNYQGTVAGSVPYYVQQNYTMLYLRRINADILGGGFSLRGVAYSRIIGDGAAWGNIELRYRFLNFRFLKQEWYFVVNPFFDAGMAVQPYRLGEMKAAGEPNREYIYSGQPERLHMSAGLGAKIVMNRNFVVGAEYGKPFDKRDGPGGLYLDVNYIF